ncbi:hypothetical protein TUM20985_00690 [Mycobacterium antarcticum]|uniref:pirin-like C-terminal cupin domain-containing protein n=1 Tax=Mycolicibacterium sp. TUM20985 TaxID=3023370 RepID=UPI00309398A7|nr:hypothetical protein TUM20985_00690 [Mycolicibacterium sp. TUM20985]
MADLWYQSPGHDTVALTNTGQGPARVLLQGGPPFGEEPIMWWNFVGRTYDGGLRTRLVGGHGPLGRHGCAPCRRARWWP